MPSGFLKFGESAAMGAQRRRIGVDVWPEISQHDQRLDLACVFEDDAGFGGAFGAEHFVLSQLVKPDELRAVPRPGCLFCLCLA